MADTPDKKVKNHVRKLIKYSGGYSVMPVMRGMSENGTPDILACVGGLFLGIETKAGKGKPTKLQCVRLREIEAAGGIALVVNEQGYDALSWLLHDCAAAGDAQAMQEVRDRIPPSLVEPFQKEE
jgi:hypothetical protein